MWLGTKMIVNSFRENVSGKLLFRFHIPVHCSHLAWFTQILHINKIRTGAGGSTILQDNKVPFSFMWSPSFVPACADWPEHVDVVGEFRDMNAPVSSTIVLAIPIPISLRRFGTCIYVCF